MDETYPILLSGETKGTIHVVHSGLFTEFTARCEDPGGLLRLSVYGDGREGYLGVMEPRDGTLTLQRRLSRTAMAAFPDPIEYAAEAGQKPASQPAPQPERSPSPEPSPTLPPLPAAEPLTEPAAEPPEEPPPIPHEPNTDLLWYQAGDGSLVTTYDGRQYRAIPMAAWGLPMEQAVERRTIDGVEYAVFAIRPSQVI